MELKERIYPAKVLLFGEYTVTTGGSALAVPYSHFNARWADDDRNYYLLEEFYDFLTEQQFSFLDYRLLQQLIESGRGLECDIPIGYGLGSSGAITAAIYDNICVSYQNKSLDQLRHELALMENFYHGAGSGTDPLVALKNKAILIGETGMKELDGEVKMPDGEWKLFLYDSGIARASRSFINDYAKWATVEKFVKEFIEPVQQSVEEIIRVFPEGEEAIVENFARISQLQYDFMQPMIIESLKPYWETGLKNAEYYFKLCGAGGGGMYLVLGKEEFLSDFNDRLILL